MSLSFQKNSFTHKKKRATLLDETKVECRFPGEIQTVLAVNATPSPLSLELNEGEAFYRGKLLLSVLYEDGEKNICRSERGMEFSHAAKNPSSAKEGELLFSVLSVEKKREGASLYLSALIEAKIDLWEEETLTFLEDGDLPTQKKEVSFLLSKPFDGVFEADDEFETEFLGDILLHGENVNVTECVAEEDSVSLAGEICLNLCALKEENKLISLERLIPFRATLPSEGAVSGDKCRAEVFVESAKISADVSEEKGKSLLSTEFTLRAKGIVTSEQNATIVEDAFSPEKELLFTAREEEEETLKEPMYFTERVFGTALLSGKIDFTDSLVCVLLPSATAEAHSVSGEETADGVLTATLVVKNGEGMHRSLTAELPFSLPIPKTVGEKKEVRILPCGVSVRQRKEGEAELEATLKCALFPSTLSKTRILSDVTEGEEYAKEDYAVSIYLARRGDTLWETAKRLKRLPEEVQRSNPDLVFPLEKEERILIYRQKKE